MTYRVQIKIKIAIGYLADLVSDYTLNDYEYTYSRSILTITKFTSQDNAIDFIASFKSVHLQSVSIVLNNTSP